ncbi:copper resistance CopC family protein [Terrabacter sp. 2YAF2]|uniref:copper resistance CopC family protein n=1 Tax=Terrabacter sp. 2YAF2 TaxID=3233026 RepID=UPI003F985596
MTVRLAGATGHVGTWRPVAALTSALLVLLGSAVTLVVAAGPAAAHDVLVSTAPANGSTVAQTPSKIVLTFTDPALSIGTQMVVTGPAGSVAIPKPRLVDNTVVQDLPGSSPAGRYTVLWRVTSADGHPVSGQISFTSRAASAPKAPETTGTAPVVEHATASGSGLPVGALLVVLIVLAILAATGWEVQRRRARGTKGM